MTYQMTYSKKKSRGVLVLIGAVVMAVTLSSAHAVPITSDLSISGTAAFDAAYAAGQLAGGATQSGNLNTTQAGANSNSTFSGATAPTSNPLSGAFTQTGDGLGFSGVAHGDSGDQYGIGIDLGFALANASLTNTYKVTFRVDFGHQINAAGDDSYTESEFFIENALLNQIFFTHLVSDTVFGNQINGVTNGDFGGNVVDPGAFAMFDFILNPGSNLAFSGNWTLRSVINSGSADAALTAFVSVDSVTQVNSGPGPDLDPGPGPTPVPEPASWLLFLIGAATSYGSLVRRSAKRSV